MGLLLSSLRAVVPLGGLAFVAPIPTLAGETAAAANLQRNPDAVAVQVRDAAAGRFDFDVTISSPYDSAARFVNGFRVMDSTAQVFGERAVWHDHADEQPFTRNLFGVSIPSSVRRVTVQTRDQRYGWGGKAVGAVLPVG